MSGIVLSPMGVYAREDDGTSISRSYRVPVTVLPSGDVELPSGTILSPKATARDVLKEMTQKNKEIGQALERKSLKPGTYFSISKDDNIFESIQHGGLFGGLVNLGGALETIKTAFSSPCFTT